MGMTGVGFSYQQLQANPCRPRWQVHAPHAFEILGATKRLVLHYLRLERVCFGLRRNFFARRSSVVSPETVDNTARRQATVIQNCNLSPSAQQPTWRRADLASVRSNAGSPSTSPIVQFSSKPVWRDRIIAGDLRNKHHTGGNKRSRTDRDMFASRQAPPAQHLIFSRAHAITDGRAAVSPTGSPNTYNDPGLILNTELG